MASGTIPSGLIPISRGGTGAASVSDALTNLGLSDSGWQELTNSAVYSGKIYYRKVWKIVEILLDDIKLKNQLSAQTWVLLHNVPTGYRSNKYSYASVIPRTPTNAYGILMIRPNGNIEFASQNGAWSTSTNTYMSVTYFID